VNAVTIRTLLVLRVGVMVTDKPLTSVQPAPPVAEVLLVVVVVTTWAILGVEDTVPHTMSIWLLEAFWST
jgi:hypothetical protein